MEMPKLDEWVDPDRIQPYHDVEDEEKYHSLVESMTDVGWQGPSVVVLPGVDHGWGPGDPRAITGSHRIAAAQFTNTEVPVVYIDTLLAQVGTSLAELAEEYGDDSDDSIEVVVRLDYHLPAEVVEHFGLDAH